MENSPTRRATAPALIFLAAIAVLGLLAVPPPARAADPRLDVTRFTTPGGRIDLDAIRRSGYQGGLDISGSTVTLDPRTGAPVVFTPQSSLVEGDDTWSDKFDAAGTDNIVRAMAVYQGRLAVAGDFDIAGPEIGMHRIGIWDGTGWQKLGTGLNAPVFALAVVADTLLVAGGEFTLPRQYLCGWNGTAWVPVGSDIFSGPVYALLTRNSTLLAGGAFASAPASHVAQWNGGGWSGMGGGLNGTVKALGLNGVFVAAGGNFDNGGGVKNIAWFDDFMGTWKAMGTGLNAPVGSLVYDPDQAVLFVGGAFTGDNAGTPLMHVAAWPMAGSHWDAVGPGLNNYVYALAVYQDGLYAGGEFTTRGDGTGVLAHVARWNGAQWDSLAAGGMPAAVRAFAVVDSGLVASQQSLFVGGDFETAGGDVGAWHIARWDGSLWDNLDGNGVSGAVNAMAYFRGRLIIGGSFTSAGGIVANAVAAWDGETWRGLGCGLTGTNMPGVVHALAVSEDTLYAGGTFELAGCDPAMNIAKWDGADWYPVGAGLDGDVYALAETESGIVAAGGAFLGPASGPPNPMSRVGVWTHEFWFPLSSGLNGPVRAMTEYDSELIVGGDFTATDGPSPITLQHIARWTNGSWASLGKGGLGATDLNGTVLALTTQGNTLYVGGGFTLPGDYIVSWQGSTWSPLVGTTASVSDTVRAIAVYRDTLYVGGDFMTAGGLPARRVARWDGQTWSRLGSGVNLDVHVLDDYQYKLYAGGDFTVAGGKASIHLAERLFPDVLAAPEPDPVEDFRVRLTPGVPNPFRLATRLEFDLPRAASVRLDLFDISGRRVRVLLDGLVDAGRLRVDWDGMDDRGSPVSPGVYFARLSVGSSVTARKLIRLR